MKFVSILLTLALCALSLVYAKPFSHPEVRCQMNCELQEFMPVCGTDDNGETRTFNNVCILKTENCLRNTSFQKTGGGVCP